MARLSPRKAGIGNDAGFFVAFVLPEFMLNLLKALPDEPNKAGLANITESIP